MSFGCIADFDLKFAEARPDLSARDVLNALVMSYQVAARAGFALHNSVSDYHTSGAWNALGVASFGCRRRSATSEQLRHAMGIAAYHEPRSQMMHEIEAKFHTMAASVDTARAAAPWAIRDRLSERDVEFSEMGAFTGARVENPHDP